MMRIPMPSRSAVALAALLGAMSATTAVAGTPGDYAWRWPLATQGDSAAWQFELTPEVYAALADRGLADFEVFDADGRPVPVARLTVDPDALPGVTEVRLPVFALTNPGDGSDDVSLRLERDSAGRLSLLQADVQSRPALPVLDYVLDADLNRDPARPSTVDRLDLQWSAAGDVRARFEVQGSDDLEHWQTLVDAASVMSLHQGGMVLERRSIAFAPTALRYLRLRLLDSDPIPGLRVSARRTRAGANAPQWRHAAARASGDSREPDGSVAYRYTLPAALPVGQVLNAAGGDNTVADVIVDAQTGSDLAQPVWVPVGQQLMFRLRQGAMLVESDALTLTSPTTAREWRIRSRIPVLLAPSLDVAYLPDRFVFLAQGRGPYTLAAGSARARRTDLPVEAALAPLRARLGGAWSPPVATLGPRAQAGGQAAYAPPARPTDWRTLLLWGLLIGGAAVVAGFALTLLRQKPSRGGD